VTPENAIDTWRCWDISLRTRPVVLRPLSGGRSNRSFLLGSNGTSMVLRLNGAESALPGANRNSEFSIWQAASVQGIAPPLLYVDPGYGFLVSAFIENHLPSQPSLDKSYVNHAFDLLKRCHQLDLDVPCIDYPGHINQYWQVIESKTTTPDLVLIRQRESMNLLLEEIINGGSPTGLCHHDPVVANFVGNSDRLYLIDWEYALHGLLVMDYAALAVEWEVDNKLITSRTGIEPEMMTMATSLYRYLCNLWEAATA